MAGFCAPTVVLQSGCTFVWLWSLLHEEPRSYWGNGRMPLHLLHLLLVQAEGKQETSSKLKLDSNLMQFKQHPKEKFALKPF